jgi:hypothetical protein
VIFFRLHPKRLSNRQMMDSLTRASSSGREYVLHAQLWRSV